MLDGYRKAAEEQESGRTLSVDGLEVGASFHFFKPVSLFHLLVSGGEALCSCQHDIRLYEEGPGFGMWSGHCREGWVLVDAGGCKGGL